MALKRPCTAAVVVWEVVAAALLAGWGVLLLVQPAPVFANEPLVVPDPPPQSAFPTQPNSADKPPVFGSPGGRVQGSWGPPAAGGQYAAPNGSMVDQSEQECPCQHPYAYLPLRERVGHLLGLQSYGDEHRGQLMQRESWLRRPLCVGWFAGGVFGGTIINDWVDGEEGFFGGLRLGYDLNQYWGVETRFSWGNMALRDSQRAIAYQIYMDDLAGYPRDHVYRRRYDGTRYASLFLWDLQAIYYPWGDSGLRPYLLVGLGTSHISFQDRAGVGHDVTQLGMPVGMGLKFRIHKSLALRVECIDNIAVASQGINTLHNLSLTGAAEFRFGGSKKHYWPWNPGTINW